MYTKDEAIKVRNDLKLMNIKNIFRFFMVGLGAIY